MRSIFFTLFALTIFLSPAIAQYDNEPIMPTRRGQVDANRLKLGVYVAPTISWMAPTSSKSDDDLYRVKSDGSRIGFAWGLMADYFFTRNYGVATGIQLNYTGGKVFSERIYQNNASKNNTVESANFTYHLQYVEVPFNLKLRTDEIQGPDIKLFGQLGLTAGINVGKKASYDVVYYDGITKTEASESHEKLDGGLTIAPVILSLNIGGGIEKPITDRISGYFGLFFNNGFVPDATDPGKYDLLYSDNQRDFSDGHIRLNNFAFRFGIFF